MERKLLKKGDALAISLIREQYRNLSQQELKDKAYQLASKYFICSLSLVIVKLCLIVCSGEDVMLRRSFLSDCLNYCRGKEGELDVLLGQFAFNLKGTGKNKIIDNPFFFSNLFLLIVLLRGVVGTPQQHQRGFASGFCEMCILIEGDYYFVKEPEMSVREIMKGDSAYG